MKKKCLSGDESQNLLPHSFALCVTGSRTELVRGGFLNHSIVLKAENNVYGEKIIGNSVTNVFSNELATVGIVRSKGNRQMFVWAQ